MKLITSHYQKQYPFYSNQFSSIEMILVISRNPQCIIRVYAIQSNSKQISTQLDDIHSICNDMVVEKQHS